MSLTPCRNARAARGHGSEQSWDTSSLLTRLAGDEDAAEAPPPALLVVNGHAHAFRVAVDVVAARECQMRHPRLGRSCSRDPAARELVRLRLVGQLRRQERHRAVARVAERTARLLRRDRVAGEDSRSGWHPSLSRSARAEEASACTITAWP